MKKSETKKMFDLLILMLLIKKIDRFLKKSENKKMFDGHPVKWGGLLIYQQYSSVTRTVIDYLLRTMDYANLYLSLSSL